MTHNLMTFDALSETAFAGVGKYGIPVLKPVYNIPDGITAWLGFNYSCGCKEPKKHGIHFFLDDYQFERVWRDPERYREMLRRFGAVCTPDFSTYTDFPRALQLWSHYKKHWCGAYWQSHGMTVIPTISWSDHASYDWCFDGEPVGGVVAVSCVGTQADPVKHALFIDGYREMMDRLKPSGIIMYGNPPAECEGNIIPVSAFQQKWRGEART